MNKLKKMNSADDDLKTIPSYFALMCLVAVIIIFTTVFSNAQTDLSGTWITENPAPYLVEYSDLHPQGEKVPHPQISILERSATMVWDLEQRKDGLISGTNKWVASDMNGEKLFEGSEPLLGVVMADQVKLSEPADESIGTAQLIFDVVIQNENLLSGVAYSVGGEKLVAMKFRLVRRN